MDQELSIRASQEFEKGNVDKAYDMALASGCLVKQFSKQEWVALMNKKTIRSCQEAEAQQKTNEALNLID